MFSEAWLAIFSAVIATLLYAIFPRAAAPRGKLPPGPWPLPIIGNLHALTSLPHRGLQRLARVHGPVMLLRLGGVPAVVFSTPRAAELALRVHDEAFASRPITEAAKHLSYGGKGMAFSEYSPYWRSSRRVCVGQLMSVSRVEEFAPMRGRAVAGLVGRLREGAGAAVDVGEAVGEVVEGLTYEMVLGKSEKDDKFDLKAIIEEVTSLIGAFNLADYVPCLGALDLQGLTKRVKKVSETIDQLMEDIIKEHQEAAKGQQEKHGDLVDVMLSLMNRPDESGLVIDRTNVKAILLDLVVASFDTATTTIVWTFSELLRNPSVMRKLQQELQSVVGLEKMVEEKDLPKLEYLDLVVKESFRLYPVAPLIVPREARRDVTVDGFFIPKKSRIIVNSWAIGRDPSVWSDDVEEFRPERFAGEDVDIRGKDFRLLPFGSGRRGCPGVQLGLVTVRLILAQLVHCFDWELPVGMKPEDIDMSETFGLSMGRVNPLLSMPTYRLVR